MCDVCCYIQQESGLWAALMIFSGLIGATCAGLIVDHFKIFKEVAVVCFSVAVLCLVWFVEVSFPRTPTDLADSKI